MSAKDVRLFAEYNLSPIIIQADQYGDLFVSISQGGNNATVEPINVDDVNSGGTVLALATQGFGYGWQGLGWDRIRVANVFHTVLATAAGTTAVWTPTAGKLFRLMGYTLSIAGTLAATGVQTIQLLDAAAIIKQHNAAVATPIVGDTQIGVDLGNGQLSAFANNVLYVSLGTAMASGSVAVNVWGTEE